MTSKEVGNSITCNTNCDKDDSVLINIKELIKTEESNDEAVYVYCVPKSLSCAKPEAFTPQFVGLGPYHHSSLKVYAIDKLKVTKAKEKLNDFSNYTENLKKSNVAHTIRYCYDRSIAFKDETLLYLMTVDALFLHDLLNCSLKGKRFRRVGVITVRKLKRNISKLIGKRGMPLVNAAGAELTMDAVIRDVFMLENQIPTCILKSIITEIPGKSTINVDVQLSLARQYFCTTLCPFDTDKSISPVNPAHLLDHMYRLIVPDSDSDPDPNPNHESDPRTRIDFEDLPFYLQYTLRFLSFARKFSGSHIYFHLNLRIRYILSIIHRSQPQPEPEPQSESESEDEYGYGYGYGYGHGHEHEPEDDYGYGYGYEHEHEHEPDPEPEPMPVLVSVSESETESELEPEREPEPEPELEPGDYFYAQILLFAILATIFSIGYSIHVILKLFARVFSSLFGLLVKWVSFCYPAAENLHTVLSNSDHPLLKPFTNCVRHARDTFKYFQQSTKPDTDAGRGVTIPSVKELHNAGIHFQAANGGISSIKFVEEECKMYLPSIRLDVNSEVIMRNLVAYESLIISENLIFTRYTELMTAIINTAEDVKLLVGEKIIQTDLSHEVVAQLFSGMSKSIKPTKTSALDKEIKKVKDKFDSTNKLNRVITKYVYSSGKFCTVLAAFVFLALTVVQTYCSVFGCYRSSKSGNVPQYGDYGRNNYLASSM